MRWLKRETGHDEGAVAVIMAILLAGGVLLGMAALVVDVGQIFAEKRQLQNGADAVALAAAQECVKNPATCQPGTSLLGNSAIASSLRKYAQDNARGTSDVTCAKVGQCSDSTADYDRLNRCPSQTGKNYVEARTRTLKSNNSTFLPPVFGRAVLGSNYAGTTVTSCAQAGWFGISAAASFKFTLSVCEWEKYTSAGYADPPPYSSPPPGEVKSREQVITYHDVSQLDCRSGPFLTPGGFGWLAPKKGACDVVWDLSQSARPGWLLGEDGAAPADGCPLALSNNLYTIVYLPVHDQIDTVNGKTWYHIKGFAAFVLTGWANIQGIKDHPGFAHQTCNANGDKCFFGVFTSALLPDAPVSSDPGSDLGARTIKLIG